MASGESHYSPLFPIIPRFSAFSDSWVDNTSERMVFPLWKSLHSLNLMLPKEDRKALLLRLFNDDTPLVNLSHRNANSDTPRQEVAMNAEPDLEQEEAEHTRRNSSSGEDDESEGGVMIADI